jgi:hypothetical protein
VLCDASRFPIGPRRTAKIVEGTLEISQLADQPSPQPPRGPNSLIH